MPIMSRLFNPEKIFNHKAHKGGAKCTKIKRT